MARFDLQDIDYAAAGRPDRSDVFFALGMMYATGAEVPADLVTAHKWFNIAAARGDRSAMRLRSEIASEMSAAQIASAQRAARAWLAACDPHR